MTKLALKPKGAVLAHAPLRRPKLSAEAREAAHLAKQAGAFGLFGLALEPADGFVGADLAYRAPVPAQAPANDWGRLPRPAFPEPPLRAGVFDPALAWKCILALDWLIVAIAAEFAARWGMGESLMGLSLGQAAAFILAALMLKLGLWITETYSIPPSRLRPDHAIGALALGAILGLLVANLLAADARAAAALAAILPCAALVLASVHAAFALWLGGAFRAGLLTENIVLVGAGEAAERLAARAAKSVRIVAIVDDRLARAPSHIGAIPVAGGVDDLLAWEHLPRIDRVIVAISLKADARLRAMLDRLAIMPNRIDLAVDVESAGVRGRGLDQMGAAALTRVSGARGDDGRAALKRAQDLVLGGLALALLAAPMLLIALAVKLESKGPALFRHRCYGLNNRVIDVLRFRTLRHEQGARARPVRRSDARATRVGAFLRRTGLDVLPQLFNVLAGDMSLVGPRPHAIGARAANRLLQNISAEYFHRHRVKPGLISTAPARPLRTFACVRACVRADLDYLAAASLWRDLQILARAGGALFAPTDRASSDAHGAPGAPKNASLKASGSSGASWYLV